MTRAVCVCTHPQQFVCNEGKETGSMKQQRAGLQWSGGRASFWLWEQSPQGMEQVLLAETCPLQLEPSALPLSCIPTRQGCLPHGWVVPHIGICSASLQTPAAHSRIQCFMKRCVSFTNKPHVTMYFVIIPSLQHTYKTGTSTPSQIH